MITKTYAYMGKNSVTICLCGINFSFHGGNINCKDGYRLATTDPISNEAFQAIIEDSELFKKKTIIVVESREHNEKNDGSSVKEPTVYTEVTDFASAVECLKKNHGIKAMQLRSPNGVKTIANSLNIVFPNWE